MPSPTARGGYGDCIMPAEVVRRYKTMRHRRSDAPGVPELRPGRRQSAVVRPRPEMQPHIAAGLLFGQQSRRRHRLVRHLSGRRGAAAHVMGRLELVGRASPICAQWSKPHQPVWTAIETTHINNPSRRPTAQDVRSEVWMALIHGAERHLLLRARVEAELPRGRRVPLSRGGRGDHAPQCADPAAGTGAQQPDACRIAFGSTVPVAIATMVKQHAGDTYVFAVNMDELRRPG